MASGPVITARIEVVDDATAKLQSVAAEAAKIQNTVGKAQRGMSSGLQAARTEYAQTQRAFATAQLEHSNAIQRSNAGLVQMRDLLKGIAAIQIGKLAYGGLKEAAAIQTEFQRALYAGLSATEAQRIQDIAISSAGKYQMNTVAEGEKTGVELRGVLSKSEDVEVALPVAMRAMQALKALGEHAEGLGPLFKAAEMAGVANDPHRLEAFVDSFVRAKSLYHDMITPELYRSTFAASRVSALTMSDDYRNRVMPLMIAEMNQGAGVGQNMVMKQAVGGFAGPQHAALKTWTDLGLIDKKDVEYNPKTGEAQKLKTGAKPLGLDLMQSDLQKWVGADFLPAALKKLNIDSGALFKMEQSEAMRKLSPLVTQAFPNGRAADEIAKIIQGLISGALQRHREMLDKSHGLGAADEALDAVSNAMAAMKTSAENLLGVLGTPVMDEAATAFGLVAKGMGAALEPLHELQKHYPTFAKIAAGGVIVGGGAAALGGMAAILNKLSGASAIKASALQLDAAATALDRSAAALTAAAEKEGVGGHFPGSGKVAGAAEGAAGATAATGGRTLLGAAGGVLARVASPALAVALGISAFNDAIDSATSADPAKYGADNASGDAIKAELAKANADYAVLAAKAQKGEIGQAFVKFAELQIDEIHRALGEHYQSKLAEYLEAGGYTPEAPVRLEEEREGRRAKALSGLPEGEEASDARLVRSLTGAGYTPEAPVRLEEEREGRRATALSNLPARALPVPRPALARYLDDEGGFEAHRAAARSEPWGEHAATSPIANVGPMKVEVASTVTGNVEGKAELMVSFNTSGLIPMIQSQIALHGSVGGGGIGKGDFIHGDQGESSHVPSPRVEASRQPGHMGHN